MPEKELSEEEKKKREWMYQNLKKGMTLKGMVKNIQPYGVFVNVGGGISGLLHIGDISNVRIESPLERFKLRQKIDVIVKNFDRHTGKLALTHKELLGTWEDNVNKFKEKTVVKGIARNRNKGGIFVELTPNLVGLAEHKSGVSYGDKVEVFIKKISPETKKIKLVILD